MDRILVSGTKDGGSNPFGNTKKALNNLVKGLFFSKTEAYLLIALNLAITYG
jgi:hypothetical protein